MVSMHHWLVLICSNKIFPGPCWTLPYKETRGNLTCNLVARLYEYLKGGRGEDHKAKCIRACRPRAGRSQNEIFQGLSSL